MIFQFSNFPFSNFPIFSFYGRNGTQGFIIIYNNNYNYYYILKFFAYFFVVRELQKWKMENGKLENWKIGKLENWKIGILQDYRLNDIIWHIAKRGVTSAKLAIIIES